MSNKIMKLHIITGSRIVQRVFYGGNWNAVLIALAEQLGIDLEQLFSEAKQIV